MNCRPRVWIVIAVLVLSVLAPRSFGADAAKRPIPPAAELDKAEKLIKQEVFPKEYADRTPAGRKGLLKALRKTADETKDDPAVRYVLLREAMSLAGATGDIEAAFAAADALGAEYAFDAAAAKLDVAQKAQGSVAGPSAAALAEGCLALSVASSEAGNYEVAARAATAAEAAARKSGDGALVLRVRRRSEDVRRLLAQVPRVQKAEKTLAEKPDDPEANLIVGRFLCFAKGQWDDGLQRLAKGGDASLKALAKLDLATEGGPADDAAGRVEAGDAWWSYADKQPPPDQPRLRERASHHYEKSLPKLTGVKRTLVLKRLIEAEATRPPAPPVVARLVPGLVVHKYSRLPGQEDSGQKPLDPTLLGAPVGEPVVAKTISPFTFDPQFNVIARGYIQIDRPGTYTFHSRSWYGRHHLFINGVMLSDFGTDNVVRSIDLRKGLHEIFLIAPIYRETNSVRIEWRTPDQEKPGPVPENVIFHDPTVRRPPKPPALPAAAP
jgi:hypothetical protein